MRITYSIDALQLPLVGGQLCHERLVLQPFVVKVSRFIIGDILRCQQLVIDPEGELWAEKGVPIIPECTSLARGSGLQNKTIQRKCVHSRAPPSISGSLTPSTGNFTHTDSG